MEADDLHADAEYMIGQLEFQKRVLDLIKKKDLLIYSEDFYKEIFNMKPEKRK